MQRASSLSALSIGLLLIPVVAFAALPSDVPADAWFAVDVSLLIEAGHLSEREPFRPSERATRGDFVTLLVKILGNSHGSYDMQSFTDIKKEDPSFVSFEEAGRQGWLTGEGNCYGRMPCFARPEKFLNRAEAAAMIVRAFALKEGLTVPSFSDNPDELWFTVSIRTAASHCILRGDEGTGRVRPEALLQRAEMIVMLRRAEQQLTYPQCNPVTTQRSKSSGEKKREIVSSSQTVSSSKEVEALEKLLESDRKVLRELPIIAAMHDEVTRQEMLKITGLFEEFVKKQEALLQIARKRKLTAEEEGDRKILGLAKVKLLEKFSALQDSAPSFEDRQVLDEMYDLAQTAFMKYAGWRKEIDTDSSERLRLELVSYDSLIEQYESLRETAFLRRLSEKEVSAVKSLNDQELQILKRMNAILQGASLSRRSPVTPAPSYTAPSSSLGDHEAYCERLRQSGGISGRWKMSSWQKELETAGCSQ